FYLCYPLVLILIERYLASRRVVILAALAALSLALCIWTSYHYKVAGFYFPHTRAWELLLGALVALGAFDRFAQGAAREALALMSLAALATVTYLYEASIPYPGLMTLIPCFATALLIATARAQATRTSR